MQTKIFPKISIVTPSFNQAEFLEDTILSILSQDYPNLEYIIIDGGSRDDSVDIIKKYARKLAYWVSEPDKGRGDAINKGFARSSGEIMSWLGCGDMYFPWTFDLMREIFVTFPEIEWLASHAICIWATKYLPHIYGDVRGYAKSGFFDGRNLSGRTSIQQESVFWRCSLWQRAGGYVDENLAGMPDFELWLRFWQQGQLYTLSAPLGGIRAHDSQQKFFKEHSRATRNMLNNFYKNNYWKKCLHEFRYSISKIKVLKRIVASYAFQVSYDLDTEKWFVEKILI